MVNVLAADECLYCAAFARVYMGRSYVNDLCVVGQHGVLREVGGEDLSRYSNKIESVGLRICPYYHYRSPTKKVVTQ